MTPARTAAAKRNLRAGIKKMEQVMTPAERVRRRIKAGRPAKITEESPSVYEALSRLASEADRARNLMREEGLDPDDIQLRVVYATTAHLGYSLLPKPGETAEFFLKFDKMAASGDVKFLGIIWVQKDHDADTPWIVWVTQFMRGTEAEANLLRAREILRTAVAN